MDAHSDNARVVKAAIAAGLYPNLLRVDAPPPRFQQVAGGTVEIPADPSKIKLFARTKGAGCSVIEMRAVVSLH